MIDILMPTIAQGLLWAIMALGVYITFRVLDIADLTVEGSFPLGAAVAAAMLSEGYSVSAALPVLPLPVCWRALLPVFYIPN